jgi:predicted  nucleic acid-binding Zn-ribbon protein
MNHPDDNLFDQFQIQPGEYEINLDGDEDHSQVSTSMHDNSHHFIERPSGSPNKAAINLDDE